MCASQISSSHSRSDLSREMRHSSGSFLSAIPLLWTPGSVESSVRVCITRIELSEFHCYVRPGSPSASVQNTSVPSRVMFRWKNRYKANIAVSEHRDISRSPWTIGARANHDSATSCDGPRFGLDAQACVPVNVTPAATRVTSVATTGIETRRVSRALRGSRERELGFGRAVVIESHRLR